jgi:hypothetical protein
VTKSDQDGRFQFVSDLAPDRYDFVALSGLIAVEDQGAEVFKSRLSSGASLTLSAAEKKSVDLPVRPAH